MGEKWGAADDNAWRAKGQDTAKAVAEKTGRPMPPDHGSAEGHWSDPEVSATDKTLSEEIKPIEKSHGMMN